MCNSKVRYNGQRYCTQLSSEPSEWTRLSPLPIPDWFIAEFELLSQSVRLTARGNIEDASATIMKIRCNDLRDWYVDHGHRSGNVRNSVLNNPKPKVISKINRDKPRNPGTKLISAVLQRDGSRCRYCGMRVFPKHVLRVLSDVLSDKVFMSAKKTPGQTNAETHGAALIFTSVVDHVFPWNCGGQTSMDNLVTSCFACNYGKAGYTLEQLGMDDPFERPPVRDGWEGLVDLIEPLLYIQQR